MYHWVVLEKTILKFTVKQLRHSWIKIYQLDVTYFIISLFPAQHVSNVSISIFRSLRLIVDLFRVLYCSGSMCVDVKVWFGWGGVVSGCKLLLFHYIMLNMFRILIHPSTGVPVQFSVHHTVPVQFTVHRTVPVQFSVHRTVPVQFTVHRTLPVQFSVHRTVSVQFTVLVQFTVHRTVPVQFTVHHTVPVDFSVHHTVPVHLRYIVQYLYNFRYIVSTCKVFGTS